jgi:hypothetical protein
MSSYLTFYVVPKAEGSKPLALVSYTRSSAIYRCFNETLNVAYIGMGDEPQYTELTISKVNEVIEDMKDEIEGDKKRVAEYEKHAAGNTDIIEYIIELKEDIEILEYFLHKVEFIKDLVEEASNSWNEYNKILCNVD